MKTILLSPQDLTISASLIVLDAIISVVLRLKLEKQIGVAAVRMVIQLVAIGYLLRLVFALNNPAATVMIVLVMVLVAGREVAARPERRFKGMANHVIGAGSVAMATVLTALLALTTAIRPHPWYDPHYAIPLAGIVLGNVLNASSIALDGVLGGVSREKAAVEARLSLGETYWAAMAPLVRTAIRRGLLPIINQMSAAGIEIGRAHV